MNPSCRIRDYRSFAEGRDKPAIARIGILDHVSFVMIELLFADQLPQDNTPSAISLEDRGRSFLETGAIVHEMYAPQNMGRSDGATFG